MIRSLVVPGRRSSARVQTRVIDVAQTPKHKARLNRSHVSQRALARERPNLLEAFERKQRCALSRRFRIIVSLLFVVVVTFTCVSSS